MIKKLIITLFLIITLNVKANAIVEEQNIYFQRYGGDKPYLSEKYKHFYVDNLVAYCVEPGMPVTTDEYIELNELPYEKEIINKLKLIGYYGFNYKNHTDNKYRMASQALIWELLGGQTVEFYTKQYGTGDYIDITKEKKEINALIEQYKIKPQLKENIEAFIDEEVIIEDENKVLDEYEIFYKGNNDVTIKDNKLIIKIKEKDKIILKRKKYNNQTTIFYEGKEKKSQLLATLSLDDLDTIEINLNPLIGQIKIIKKANKETNYSLENAIYGIYDINDNLIKELKTNNEGIIELKINKGSYYIKEIKPPLGYYLDETKYSFLVNEENLYQEIQIEEKVIESKIIIHKKFGYKELYDEPNITFAVYQNNNLISNITTNEEGIAQINLAYGKYLIKQINTKEGYLKVEDFEVNVDEKNKEITYNLIDKEINAFIKIIKIDEENKIIKQKGIKFKIKNLDTNEYICENENCTYETNEEGYLITKEKLKGNIQIEECKQKINGYIWNKEKIKIFIGDKILENNTFIVKFKNKRVKGQIELLKLSENNIPLENVIFNLYAKENIIINNEIIYKKDELIQTKTTNKEGKIIYNNLELGKYYLKEIKTNDNYILDENNHLVELNYIDEETKIVNKKIKIINCLKKGKLIFNKIDSLTQEKIEGTTIQIYKEDELIYENKTNIEGQIIIDNLIEGLYYIIEKEPKEGYIKNEEKIPFEIKYNETTNITMENDPYIEVPNTMKNNNYLIILLLGILLKKYEKII